MNAYAGDLRPVENDPLEHAGHSILELIQKSSAMAEQNTQHAINAAHRLAVQLRASEDRIAELEAALRSQRARADRAEEWLKRISHEIEQTLSPTAAPTAPAPSLQPGPALQPGIEAFVKGRQKAR